MSYVKQGGLSSSEKLKEDIIRIPPLTILYF